MVYFITPLGLLKDGLYNHERTDAHQHYWAKHIFLRKVAFILHLLSVLICRQNLYQKIYSYHKHIMKIYFSIDVD